MRRLYHHKLMVFLYLLTRQFNACTSLKILLPSSLCSCSYTSPCRCIIRPPVFAHSISSSVLPTHRKFLIAFFVVYPAKALEVFVSAAFHIHYSNTVSDKPSYYMQDCQLINRRNKTVVTKVTDVLIN